MELLCCNNKSKETVVLVTVQLELAMEINELETEKSCG